MRTGATTSDGDYIAKTGTLTFAPGETTEDFFVRIVSPDCLVGMDCRTTLTVHC